MSDKKCETTRLAAQDLFEYLDSEDKIELKTFSYCVMDEGSEFKGVF
jgi:hypothetical protein